MKQFLSMWFALFFLMPVAMCQQAPQYSLYMLNRYQFNPAFAGLDASLSINGAYRSQWADIPGNPVQQNINAHMPFYLLNGAFGMNIQTESIGAEKTTTAALSYNYVYETDFGLISGGLSLGMLQKSLDGTILRAPDGTYEGPTINHNDPEIPNGIVRGIRPMVSAGLYFAGDYFEAGIAMTDYTFGDVILDQTWRFSTRPHYNFFFEYFIENFDKIQFYPSVFIKSDFNETQIELSVRALYDDFLTAGAGFRGFNSNSVDAVILFAGFRLSENLSFIYAYDMTLSPLNNVSSGSHEIVMKYNLNKIIGAGLPPKIIYNPRFLE